MGGLAWVTLATNDSYSLGALVLAHSLRRVGTQHDLVVLITPGVTESMREKLASVFTVVKEVNVLDSKDEINLAVLQRPELGITFTKLHCWRLTQYEKCVFVDADALVVRNCDELFEREELSAAPDVGWPDCFNSGVFVFKPSQQTFASLTTFAISQGSFDGADQGLLNMYFSDWAHKDISKHLPFIYNMCSTATYSYAPAFKQYGENVRIVHFIGNTKPWLQYFDTLTGIVQPPSGCNHLQPLLQTWWNIFCDSVHPQLTDVMVASNMTTIRHSFLSYPSYSSIYNSINEQRYPDRDQSKAFDFSEFNDPWENYVDKRDISFENLLRQTDDSRQSESSSNNHVEPPRLMEHNQCGAEPPPLPLPSYQSSEQQYHHSFHSHETLQASHQENFSFERNEVNQLEQLEHQHASQMLTNQLRRTEEDELQSLTQDINQLAAFCNFLEQFHEHSEDDSHAHHQTHHVDVHDIHQTHQSHDNQNKQNSFTFAPSNLQDNSQSLSHNYYDYTQTDLHEPSSSHSQYSLPCTDPNNITPQSELRASPCIQNAEGGLAGALSKLTLGESRTDEQQAIEDHIRKQNWEQGNIDFMGRDSFDNILKKINETLSSASAEGKQPSPVQETQQPKKSSSKSSEVEAAVEGSEVALPVLASEDQAESNTTLKLSDDTCQRISSSGDESLSTKDIQQLTQTQTSSNLAASETINVIPGQTVISTEGIVEPAIQSDLKVNEPVAAEIVAQTEKELEKQDPEAILIQPSMIELEKETNISQVDISATQIAAEVLPDSVTLPAEVIAPVQTTSQIISEAVTEYPVPIQVAESVLQAEPKESVAEDPRPVIEAVVSSIIPPVQESAATISETLIEPGQNENINQQHQLNGNDPTLQLEVENTLPSSKSSPLTSQIEIVSSGQDQSVLAIESETSALVVPQPTAQIEQQSETTIAAQVEQKPATPVDAQPAALVESQPTSQVKLQTVEIEPEPTVQAETQSEAEIKVPTTTQVELQSAAQVEPQTVAEIEPQQQLLAAQIEIQKAAEVESQTAENAEILSQKSKLIVKLPEAEESKEKISESPAIVQSQPELKGKDAENYENPERPNRSKDLKIPGTPTVIEATPPTSPPLDIESIQSAEEAIKKQTESTETVETQASSETCDVAVAKEEKESLPKGEAESQPAVKDTAKKIEKKSSAESDSPSTPEAEGSTKKVVKKVVKKVSKKSKEGEDESSSAEKPTKKTVKKVAKTSTSSLEADQNVPETPPPSADSEPPVPPKRKAKSSSSTKSAGKKPDES